MTLKEVASDILFAGYVTVLMLVTWLFLDMGASTQAHREFLQRIPW